MLTQTAPLPVNKNTHNYQRPYRIFVPSMTGKFSKFLLTCGSRPNSILLPFTQPSKTQMTLSRNALTTPNKMHDFHVKLKIPVPLPVVAKLSE